MSRAPVANTIRPDEEDRLLDIHSCNCAKKNPFGDDAISAQTFIRKPGYEFVSYGGHILKNGGFRIISVNDSCRDRIVKQNMQGWHVSKLCYFQGRMKARGLLSFI